MTYTRAIGLGANKIIRLIVRGLALSKINPNVLTFFGLVDQHGGGGISGIRAASAPPASSSSSPGLFDMVDGRVARATNQVTRFGAFFDSVLDRYSDLALLVGLLVYYGTINQAFVRGPDCHRDDSFGHDQLHPHPRGKHHSDLQSRLSGAARTRGAADHRRIVRPHGAGAVGHRGSRQSDSHPPHDLHLPGSAAVGAGAAPAGNSGATAASRACNPPLNQFPSSRITTAKAVSAV